MSRESFNDLKAIRRDLGLTRRSMQERDHRVLDSLPALAACFDQKLSMEESKFLDKIDELARQHMLLGQLLTDSSDENESDASALVSSGGYEISSAFSLMYEHRGLVSRQSNNL